MQKKYFRNHPLLIIMAEMGFGAGSVGLFLGDESERRTGDMGKENAGEIKSVWVKKPNYVHNALNAQTPSLQ